MEELEERRFMEETTIIDRCKMVCKKIAKYRTEESDGWEAMVCFEVVLRKNGCSCVYCTGWVKEAFAEAFVDSEFPLWFLLIDDEEEMEVAVSGEYDNK